MINRDVPMYQPQEGDEVVIHKSRFNPEGYEAAKRITTEGFGAAMEASGQTRKTCWLADPETREIVGISFFQKGHSVEEWHAHDARQDVLDKLAP